MDDGPALIQTARARDGAEIRFVERGDPAGPPVFLGPHCYASSLEGRPPPDSSVETTLSWVDLLADRFRVIIADYPPGVGETRSRPGRDFTAAVAVDDLEAILDAAGVERAGLVGYSFGGALAVQVACRSDRLSAVAIGGWPPLEAPFRRLAEITADLAASPPEEIEASGELLRSAAGFYASLVDWPERAEVPGIGVPRLVFMGGEDEFDAPNPTLADRLRRAERDLRALGWEIAWVEGADHVGAMDGRASGPIVRAFLERALAEATAAP